MIFIRRFALAVVLIPTILPAPSCFSWLFPNRNRIVPELTVIQEAQEDPSCSICFQPFDDDHEGICDYGDKHIHPCVPPYYYPVLKCSHNAHFCGKCIDRHSTTKTMCPLCNEEFLYGSTSLPYLLGLSDNENTQVLEYFLDSRPKGFNIDQRNVDGSTEFMTACLHGYDRVANVLIKHGANPILQDIHGNNALTNAVSRGSLACVQLILSHAPHIVLINIESTIILIKMAKEAKHLDILLLLSKHIEELSPIDADQRAALLQIIYEPVSLPGASC